MHSVEVSMTNAGIAGVVMGTVSIAVGVVCITNVGFETVSMSTLGVVSTGGVPVVAMNIAWCSMTMTVTIVVTVTIATITTTVATIETRSL